jgi:hypothetical protein
MVVRKYPTVNFLPAVLEGWQSAKLRGRVWSKFLLCAGYLCTGKYKFYRVNLTGQYPGVTGTVQCGFPGLSGVHR